MEHELNNQLTQRVRNSTLFIPIHPEIIEADFEGYANLNLINILAENTGFKKAWEPEIQVEINHMKKLLEEERQEKREQRQKEYLAKSTKIPKKTESVNKQDYANLKQRGKLERILKHLPPDDYYSNSPIKPGFGFLECLINGRRSITSLQINIPESYYCSDRPYFLYTNANGFVDIRTDFRVYEFMQRVFDFKVHSNNEMDQIAAVFRVRGDLWMSTSTLMWDQFRSRIESHDLLQSTLLQRYIRTPGDRPSIIRIFFSNFDKNHRANVGINITNDLNQMETLSPYKRYLVDTNSPQTWDMVNVTGHALRPFEIETKKIIKFIEKSWDLRLEEIVLDFIKDTNGKIWLCNCKGFKIDVTSLNKSVLNLTEPKLSNDRISSLPQKRLVNTRSKSESCEDGIIYYAHCKLCRLNYPHSKLAHLVSERMIVVFRVHIETRRNKPFDNVSLNIVNNEMLSQSVRVCEFCFTLISSEFELIKLEKELAERMGITINNYKTEVLNQFLPPKMQQWRILLIFHKLELSHKLKSLYLQIRFHNQITCFKIENLAESLMINLPFLKLYFLFLAEDKYLRGFFKNFQIEMRITQTSDWDSFIASSKHFILMDLPFYMTENQAMATKKKLYLYNEDIKYFGEIGLTIGISNDSKIETKYIYCKLEKCLDTYIPPDSYYRSDPLPDSWMEVLGVQSEFSTFGPKTHKEFYYTPCLTKTELKRMESVYPLDSPIKTEKFPRHASIYLTLKSDISATGLELKNLKHIKKKKLSENVDDYLTSRRTFSNLTTRTLGTSREVTTRASSAKRTNKMVKSNLNLLANKIYKKIVKK